MRAFPRFGRCLAAAGALLWTTGSASGQVADPGGAARAEPWTLATAGGTLHGTLLVPGGHATVPVVLIHPGSGPTDRDGNTPLLPGKNNSLRLLAEGLAERGIATLRLDKRGIAASAAAMSSESDLRLETYVTDLVGWVELLRRTRRFGSLVVLGHSEGSLIGALAAQRVEVEGYVSVAGPARKGSDILRRQLEGRIAGSLVRENERILSALERGERIDPVPRALEALYRPSVQPYLVSWFRYVPAEEVARLALPVLIVQGTTDLQVDTLEGKALAAASPGARYLPISGMNHVLKLAAGTLSQQLASYGDSTLPVAPMLLDSLAGFIRGLR